MRFHLALCLQSFIWAESKASALAAPGKLIKVDFSSSSNQIIKEGKKRNLSGAE